MIVFNNFFRSKKPCSGMTLLEVLVSVAVLIPALIAILYTYISNLYWSDLLRQKNIALDHQIALMETIKCTSFSNMLSKFPNAVIDGPVANPYSNIVGGYTLGNEHIRVTYTNPSADPLEIIVTVTWQDIIGRPLTSALTTMRTS